MRYFEAMLSGRSRRIDFLILRVIALCFSLIYIVIVQFRLLLYRRGLLRAKTLEANVISIGNITLGGTGKTPVVACLAGYFKQKGRRVGVLSRGYKRTGRGLKIVSDGHTIRLTWPEAGDEPSLLAHRLPGIPIIVGEDRSLAGQYTIDTLNVDTLLLDDGFQHMKLRRDTDIVVIDATTPFGNGRIFPAGHLREPVRNLKRANLFWLTKVDQAKDLRALEERLQTIQSEANIVHSIFQPIGLRCLQTGAEVDVSILKGARTVLLCGIANPTSFEKTLSALETEIIEMFTFPDHHPFTASEMTKVQTVAAAQEAKLIVTTEKDGVRIPIEAEYVVPIYELIIEVQITVGEELLEKRLWN